MADPDRGGALRLATTIPAVFATVAVVLALHRPLGPVPSRLVGIGLGSALLAIWSRRDGTPLGDFGLIRPRFLRIVGGLALGFLLVGLVVGVMLVAGWYRPVWIGFQSAMVGAVLFALTAALFEELMLRAVWFGGIEPVLGTHLTVLVRLWSSAPSTYSTPGRRCSRRWPWLSAPGSCSVTPLPPPATCGS
jgi:hypothetical protein